jgi:hypothetical protein
MRDDVILKIQRANKHIKDFYTAREAFIKSDPYRVAVKRNSETRQLIYYLDSVASVPDDLALIAGDALQNLRTSLDYLVHRLVKANGGTPSGHTGFPIFDAAPITSKDKRIFARKIEGMKQEAKDIIHAIKPYRGGDDVLWRLHKLNIRDKHRLLFTVGSAFRGFNIGRYMAAMVADTLPGVDSSTFPDLWVSPKESLFPLKAGDELFVDGADAKPNKDMKFDFDVSLNEPGVVAGEPVIAVLGITARRVFRVISEFEAFW